MTEPLSIEPLSGIQLLGRLLTLDEKIRLGCKGLASTNPQAYSAPDVSAEERKKVL